MPKTAADLTYEHERRIAWTLSAAMREDDFNIGYDAGMAASRMTNTQGRDN